LLWPLVKGKTLGEDIFDNLKQFINQTSKGVVDIAMKQIEKVNEVLDDRLFQMNDKIIDVNSMV